MKKCIGYLINWRTCLKGKSGGIKNSAQKVLHMQNAIKDIQTN